MYIHVNIHETRVKSLVILKRDVAATDTLKSKNPPYSSIMHMVT